jgi:hypothetical protein
MDGNAKPILNGRDTGKHRAAPFCAIFFFNEEKEVILPFDGIIV